MRGVERDKLKARHAPSDGECLESSYVVGCRNSYEFRYGATVEETESVSIRRSRRLNDVGRGGLLQVLRHFAGAAKGPQDVRA
jgi:hypothetical protein